MARKKKEEPPVDVTLPITPMLDMSFQLLSFFILTFHPMPQEGQLAINLPKPDTANVQKSEPLPEDENKKDEWVISVFATSDEMSLQGPTTRRDNLKFADLQRELKAIPKPSGRGNEAISITIEASDDLVYARLIEVMNLCKYIGYESIGVSTLRPAAK